MNLLDNPLISVIIPVYNVSSYLGDCLDSIINQAYNNVQIIIIDDGSTDGSSAICDEYQNRDSRILVIHQNNQGVSSARNRGLDEVKGEYIFFLDADDVLGVDILDDLCLFNDKTDLVVSGSIEIDANGKLNGKSNKLPQRTITQNEMLTALFDESIYGYLGVLTPKIFKAEIVMKYHLRFDSDIMSNEDRLFITRYLVHSRDVQLSTNCSYYYRQRSDSTIGEMKNRLTPAELTVVTSFERIRKVVVSVDKDVYYLVCRRGFECCLSLYHKANNRLQKKQLSGDMWENALLYIKSPSLTLLNKMKVIIHCLIKS